MPLAVRPLCGDFAAEITGAPHDLRVDESAFRTIEAAWCRHPILVFRALDMAPADHVAFTRRLGTPHIMVPGEFNLPDQPEVWVVGNAEADGKPLGLRGAGMGYHPDGEDKQVPNAGSCLYARIVPPDGGDTLFADMYSAYEVLPAAVKAKLAGRRARFSRAEMHRINYPDMRPYTAEELAARPDVFHPLARRHPKSGRTALYIGRWACDI
ncbi:MAG: TauD/TfdA dioxygenase family protein, partial [Stellaceae bacterium]